MAARRGGSKALCQMEDEYVGNILYKFRDKASEHLHAARRATN